MVVRAHITVSLDGFMAGPDQSEQEPLGRGGEDLHRWMFSGGERDSALRERIVGGIGAVVMGRNMFGPVRGEWNRDWRGWWGEDPPYHAPVFVLTHHPHDPIEMQGGTTFHFVTEGIEAALQRAREAAGDRDVSIAGGASTVNQFLAAGLLDQLTVDYSPILLGGGARLFEGVGPREVEIAEVVAGERATHVTYRTAPSP